MSPITQDCQSGRPPGAMASLVSPSGSAITGHRDLRLCTMATAIKRPSLWPIPATGGGSGGPVTGVVSSAAAAAFNSGGKAILPLCSAPRTGSSAGWRYRQQPPPYWSITPKAGAVSQRLRPDDQHAGWTRSSITANFNSGKVDSWDGKLNPLTRSPANAFVNSPIPAGFASFNIQDDRQLPGNVTYAKQDAEKHDDVAGAGNGYVAVARYGRKPRRRIWLAKGPAPIRPGARPSRPPHVAPFPNARWSETSATAASMPTTPSPGRIARVSSGPGRSPAATPPPFQGLWSLSFGSGAQNEDPGTLYFTAGPGGGPNNDPVESHGLLRQHLARAHRQGEWPVERRQQPERPDRARHSFAAISGNAFSLSPPLQRTSGTTTEWCRWQSTVNEAAASFIGNTQINFLVPADVQLGPATGGRYR